MGGSFPLVYSILSDLFPSSRRNFVSSLIILASGIGVAVGQGLAGTVGPALGWRVPFVMVGAPSILVAGERRDALIALLMYYSMADEYAAHTSLSNQKACVFACKYSLHCSY